jgi:hypothetical protein
MKPKYYHFLFLEFILIHLLPDILVTKAMVNSLLKQPIKLIKVMFKLIVQILPLRLHLPYLMLVELLHFFQVLEQQQAQVQIKVATNHFK